MRDGSGQLTHFIGYHRDASERLKSAERSAQGLPPWLREDRLTGCIRGLISKSFYSGIGYSRSAIRTKSGSRCLISTTWATYNETFDKAAGMRAFGASLVSLAPPIDAAATLLVVGRGVVRGSHAGGMPRRKLLSMRRLWRSGFGIC